jgi:hypothetical protein
MMFGEFLILHGIINRDQLSEALKRQNEHGILLGETLVTLGYLPKDDLDRHLEEHLLYIADDIVRDHRQELAL